MTEKCKRFQEQFVDALYQELPPPSRAQLEAHLDSCPSCRSRFEGMERTLSLMSRRLQPELPEDYWSALEDRIERRIDQQRRLESRHWSLSGPFLKIAAAIVLVLAGVAIDRVLLRRDAPAAADNPTVALQRDDLDLQVTHYLGRSQLLLLAVANIDTRADGAESIDLSAQKNVARELLAQSESLREALHQGGQRRLASLVQDLGKVMIQIANLEERRGLRQVRLIQKSVLQSDLLVRVNLKQLRPTWSNRS